MEGMRVNVAMLEQGDKVLVLGHEAEDLIGTVESIDEKINVNVFCPMGNYIVESDINNIRLITIEEFTKTVRKMKYGE